MYMMNSFGAITDPRVGVEKIKIFIILRNFVVIIGISGAVVLHQRIRELF